MWITVISALALALVVGLHITRRHLKGTRLRSTFPLPPGPRRLPLIGNIAGVDKKAPWLTYAEWAKKYGDIVYTRLLGSDIVIVSSEEIAKDLLENRSRNYSDRPYLVTKKLCGRDFSSIFMEYGDRWRLHRRFFHQSFRREAVHRFKFLYHRKGCQLLRRLLDSPEQFSDHVFEYTGSVILNSVYDYDAKSRKDELFDIIERTLRITTHALRPDISILVGAFPALLRLPSWLPGMSFKREMANVKELSKRYVNHPFEHSLRRLSAGSTAQAMVFDALRNVEATGTSTDAGLMKDLSEAAATAFIAGAETSNSVIMMFLLMMALNPQVQKKAQAQIDTVVGGERLPTMEDRPLLPYIDAILREVLRYAPPAPLAVPHSVVDDDVYAGFHIPKGTLVITNLWLMSHNEFKYPNPHEFIPERFLNNDGTLNDDNLENITFGFGRRICVGRHFADTSVWSVITKILATFTVETARDENGVEIPIEPKYDGGVVVRPLPFRCSVVPRTPGMNAEKLEQLIEASDA